MAKTTWPLGVCVLPEPPLNMPRTAAYPNYIHEILVHAGLCYTRIPADSLAARLDEIGILVTIGEQKFSDDLQKQLRSFVEAGGAWISVGGTCGMDDLLGVAQLPAYSGFGAGVRTLGEGYLTPQAKDHPML